MPKAAIIIPTYNEKENIRVLIGKIKKQFPKFKKWETQILVVDGNSPDGTAKLVIDIRRKQKGVHLLLEKTKRGLGSAYLTGMKHATEKLGADLLITMDADLSHDPTYLSKFFEKIESGCDFVVGSRYIKGGSIAESWAPHRKFLSVFGNLVTQAFLGSRQIQDWTTGYRAIKKEVYKKVVSQMEKDNSFRGYTFNISFAHHAVEAGFKAGEVPIHFYDRKAGQSKLGLEYLLHTPIFLLKTRLKKLFPVY